MKFRFQLSKRFPLIVTVVISGVFFILLYLVGFYYNSSLKYQIITDNLLIKQFRLVGQLKNAEKEVNSLKNQDQYVINQKLEGEIKNIHNTYQKAVSTYEDLLKFKETTKNTEEFDKLFTASLTLLAERNYASAGANLTLLSGKIVAEKEKIAASFAPPVNLPQANAPPTSGYRRQMVQTDIGSFMVDIVTADLNSTRVIVDTASDSDCSNDCPVLPLSDYVSRNGAFAGVNGSYFCPATYPSCAGKTNTYDTLLMNKNKKYFNSDNNVYSTVPVAVFKDNWARFMGQSLEWGRDTGVDAVIANYPLLVFGGNINYQGSSDPKLTSKGGRSFIGATDSTVYIGVVFNASLTEAAHTLHTLGIRDALNLDDGGSTALWFGGYKAGPGRNLPNAVLFVRK